jgi:hypothetical protein
MARTAGKIAVLKALATNPRILRAKPRALGFLGRYMREFRVQRAGRNLILHSHLPPLNSRAYGRFIDEHLVARSEGPSHAQVGLTDRCPQNCAYCYNRGRKGAPMDTATILRVIRELRELGVFWLGFTGGEPLLNKDIVGITESASRDCAVKLFTTGCGLTQDLAAGLRDAGPGASPGRSGRRFGPSRPSGRPAGSRSASRPSSPRKCAGRSGSKPSWASSRAWESTKPG